MAETPHSQETQDDQAPPPLAIGSYGPPSSSAGQAAAPTAPETTAPDLSESPVLPLGYSPVSGTPAATPSQTWSATVAGADPAVAPAAAANSPAPPAGSYGGPIGVSHGGSYGASKTQTTAQEAATSIPTIGSSVEVPPLGVPPLGVSPLGGEGAEGGEWDLLSGKLRDWFQRNDLGGQWDRLGGPLRASGLLLAGLILIKLYEALLDTLDDIPLLPRLLQLAGLLYVLNFGFTHLIKSQDRENLYRSWKKRWHDFTGRP